MAYTILVVDDSSIIRSVLERTIAMTKLPVDELLMAQHGKEALDLLKTKWVDIVFTDINMPVMSGIELFDTMSADPALKEIPVVIISTEGSAQRIAELRSKGVKGYLRKPFTPETIRDIILETLGGWE